ncbi:unnamed protein product [Linum trigynum]|uniref:Uncharacterized protein n=1 Tax=Linum trigynum TaxID=586398 RepID=A0AAV2E759_9ROSI
MRWESLPIVLNSNAPMLNKHLHQDMSVYPGNLLSSELEDTLENRCSRRVTEASRLTKDEEVLASADDKELSKRNDDAFEVVGVVLVLVPLMLAPTRVSGPPRGGTMPQVNDLNEPDVSLDLEQSHDAECLHKEDLCQPHLHVDHGVYSEVLG